MNTYLLVAACSFQQKLITVTTGYWLQATAIRFGTSQIRALLRAYYGSDTLETACISQLRQTSHHFLQVLILFYFQV